MASIGGFECRKTVTSGGVQWRRWLAHEGPDLESSSGVANGSVVASCLKFVVPIVIESVMTVSPMADHCGVPT